MRKLAWIGGAIILLTTLSLWVLDRLSAFEIGTDHLQAEHQFDVAGISIAGTLLLPSDTKNPPVVLIVHGDGPQDRWSESTYLPMVNYLLDAGIGVFSWDKPGIGKSTGNWLDQSMEDRTAIASAGLAYLRDDVGIASTRLGYLGFSQAGWVVPQASEDADAAFSVLIGPAVNWRRQGAYFARTRLTLEGASEAQATEQAAAQLAERDDWFRNGAACLEKIAQRLERCNFGALNYEQDASDAIAAMSGPALVLVGTDDLNVDPTETSEIYGKNPAINVVSVSDATHSLLRAEHYNFQTPNKWTTWVQMRFTLAGQSAYVPGVLSQITDWINAR